jgi:hypothetical protein
MGWGNIPAMWEGNNRQARYPIQRKKLRRIWGYEDVDSEKY